MDLETGIWASRLGFEGGTEEEEEEEEKKEEEEGAGLPALPLPRSYQRPAGKALGTQGATAKLEHRSREDD